MFKIGFAQSAFISPTDPSTRIEPAIDCDGSICGCALHEADGTLIDLPPHYHLVESQQGAWERRYPIDGQLP